jgi:hypothetical protein
MVDPYPLLLANAALGMMRATFAIWANIGGSVPLDQLVDAAFSELAAGLPERCMLRELVARGPGGATVSARPGTEQR